MENTLIHKVYYLINEFIHPNGTSDISPSELSIDHAKVCPVTGLDISMQPKNSKFISPLGVQWYHTHRRELFRQKLLPYLHHRDKNNPQEQQFTEIAHNIRNADSNPRNNTRRKIKKILDDQNCLFNNLELIDSKKMKEAGFA